MSKFGRPIPLLTKLRKELGPKPPAPYVEPRRPEPDEQGEGMTACLICGKVQEDRGQDATCVKCGMQPVPSAAYPRSSAFHTTFRRRNKR